LDLNIKIRVLDFPKEKGKGFEKPIKGLHIWNLNSSRHHYFSFQSIGDYLCQKKSIGD
jgi:hypothetical protein